MSGPQVNLYKFKAIAVVPGAKQLIDITLSKTQRKTPTEIHKQFKISRIRSFYMRKVKFCQQAFQDKFNEIIGQFPKLDEIHPFYGDLCNVLYDRDHYKLALGQVNTVKTVVGGIGRDYVRLMKYADSLYKCKMLKRAALGRMATTVRKLNAATTYLEQVRQHLGRLPSINPHTRTLILAGYPNVGKSSFMNQISEANVDVQPYAFTTKSLFVGHFDFAYCRWQVIDTPGILDRPLDERNTIEMTAITALAHIQASILYFLDLSEQCGYTLADQVKLFESMKPLFANKPVLIVLNKIDQVNLEQVDPDMQTAIQNMIKGVEQGAIVRTSSLGGEGVDAAKNMACEMLLAQRVLRKGAQSSRIDSIANRLTVTSVTPPAERPPVIPESVQLERSLPSKDTEATIETERDIAERLGGPGVYSKDMRKQYIVADESWRYDVVPEILDGKNVADFVDSNIEQKLKQLELEEALLAQGDASIDARFEDPEWKMTEELLAELHCKINLQRIENNDKTKRNGPALIPRGRTRTRPEDVRAHLNALGYDGDSVVARPDLPKFRKIHRARSTSVLPAASMEIDEAGGSSASPTASRRSSLRSRLRETSASRFRSGSVRDRSRSLAPTRIEKSMPTLSSVKKSETLMRKDKGLVRRNKRGMLGEADRFIGNLKPKHLLTGKRGVGKTTRR
eukprot:GHVT01087426.1.p1 GENE.GHVT01087426.1~~GHVT01087426.1.p1  ORF type:complete len:680 (+),score=139.40 GHVT01087426.1:256-2295(+)